MRPNANSPELPQEDVLQQAEVQEPGRGDQRCHRVLEDLSPADAPLPLSALRGMAPDQQRVARVRPYAGRELALHDRAATSRPRPCRTMPRRVRGVATVTVGKKALSIGFDNIGWLDGLENGPDDYCAHAHAVLRRPTAERASGRRTYTYAIGILEVYVKH